MAKSRVRGFIKCPDHGALRHQAGVWGHMILYRFKPWTIGGKEWVNERWKMGKGKTHASVSVFGRVNEEGKRRLFEVGLPHIESSPAAAFFVLRTECSI